MLVSGWLIHNCFSGKKKKYIKTVMFGFYDVLIFHFLVRASMLSF